MSSLNSLLDSKEFQQVLGRYYPPDLRDHQVRWRRYQRELNPYARAAEQATSATERLIVIPLATKQPGRFVCRLDRDAAGRNVPPFTKSPASIDDKIFRYLSGRRVNGQECTGAIVRRLEKDLAKPEGFLRLFFHQLPEVMNDLARFRIVCNLLEDVREVTDSFNPEVLAIGGIDVAPNLEDRIESDRWEEGASGHRAVHARLWVPVQERKLGVEVQIMTVFELGWDLKAHLLYEAQRRGGKTDKRTRLKVRAISDAVYVADVLFDEVMRSLRGDDA